MSPLDIYSCNFYAQMQACAEQQFYETIQWQYNPIENRSAIFIHCIRLFVVDCIFIILLAVFIESDFWIRSQLWRYDYEFMNAVLMEHVQTVS